MSLDWRVVPIEHWPGELTLNRKRHPFRYKNRRGWMQHGVNWTSTMETLKRELKELKARDILLQMAVTEREIRHDGWIRANARPDHPGVILTFDSRHGPLSYPCDTFDDWQANVRAIALALEALRKVDRYGVTRRGEQYRGWAKLPPAGGSTDTLTAEAAARVLIDAASISVNGGPERLLRDPELFTRFYRGAAAATHPDRAGSADSITCPTPLPPPLLTDSTPALVTLFALCINTVLALCNRALHEAGRGGAFLQERVWLVLGQGLGSAS